MKRMKIIAPKNLPGQLPLTSTITLLLCIKVYGLSAFWIGVIYSFIVLNWLLEIIVLVIADYEDIFKK